MLHFSKQSIRILFPLLFCFFISLPGYSQIVRDYILNYREDLNSINRFYNSIMHDSYYDNITNLQQDYLKKLDKLDYNNFGKDDRLDFHIFRNFLQKQQHQHNIILANFSELKYITDFAEPLYKFIAQRRRAKKINPIELSAHFSNAEKHILTQIKMIEKEAAFDSKQKATIASNIITSLSKNLSSAYDFYNNYDPAFAWWTSIPMKQLNVALDAYAQALEKSYKDINFVDDGSGIHGNPIGRKNILALLEFEYIPYSPEKLIEIAHQQYAWCENEMIKISNNLGFGNNWKKALEHVKDQYLPPGEWPDVVGQIAEEVIDYLEDKDLITIPPLAKSTWRMNMITAEAQKLNAFFLGGESIYIAYPTNEMSHEEKLMSLRGNNPHFGRAVVHHELIPGHHMQQFMNSRNHAHRTFMGSPFWVEGWPLYWEFTLYEMGYPRNEMDKIGMLFWRMHRAVRIIFSLQYHLGNMSPQQCIDMLVDKVGHERFNAESEVRRSFTSRYDPLYQLAYMIGGLQVTKLKQECVDSGKMSLKEFHDRFISQNNMPIELLRSSLLEMPLQKNHTTSWKFLDKP